MSEFKKAVLEIYDEFIRPEIEDLIESKVDKLVERFLDNSDYVHSERDVEKIFEYSMGSYVDEVNDLRSGAEKMDSNIDDLESRYVELEEQLDDKVADLEDKIADLKLKISDLENENSDLKYDLEQLANKVDNNHPYR